MWEVKPTLIIALALMAVVYASAATALKRQPSTKQIAAYTVALLMLIGALSGPIDWLARNRLFSAYIFQQMLLIFVVPPLILLGLPDWMVRPVMMNRMVEPVARFLTRPLVAFLRRGCAADGEVYGVGFRHRRHRTVIPMALT